MGQALAVMHVGELSCRAMSGIFIPVWESTPGKLAGKRAHLSVPTEIQSRCSFNMSASFLEKLFRYSFLSDFLLCVP